MDDADGRATEKTGNALGTHVAVPKPFLLEGPCLYLMRQLSGLGILVSCLTSQGLSSGQVIQ